MCKENLKKIYFCHWIINLKPIWKHFYAAIYIYPSSNIKRCRKFYSKYLAIEWIQSMGIGLFSFFRRSPTHNYYPNNRYDQHDHDACDYQWYHGTYKSDLKVTKHANLLRTWLYYHNIFLYLISLFQNHRSGIPTYPILFVT